MPSDWTRVSITADGDLPDAEIRVKAAGKVTISFDGVPSEMKMAGACFLLVDLGDLTAEQAKTLLGVV